MDIIKRLTRKLEEKTGVSLDQKLSRLKKSPAEPESRTRVPAFCDAQSKKPCITVCTPRAGCNCFCGGIREAVVGELGAGETGGRSQGENKAQGPP